MKVVSVSHYYTPHVGGLEIVAEQQVKSLRNEGHCVSVVTCAAAGEVPLREEKEGVSIFRMPAINFFDTRFGIPFPLAGWKLLKTLWKEIKTADVVQLHDVFYIPSWFTYGVARIQKKPLILTQHVGIVEHPSLLITAVQKLVYQTVGRLIFSYAQHIIVYNPHVREFLIECGVPRAKITQLYNGVDTTRFSPRNAAERSQGRLAFGLPVDRPLALFVGRFVPKKGYDVLYEARDAAYDLVYVGSGTIPAEWETAAHFHNLGALSQQQLAELYPLVDVFVFPARGEIFTLVMQEAMAAGVPVIASYEPGYDEYEIDRDRLLLCAPDAATLRTHILKVITDTELSARMRTYSRELAVRLFDWNTNVRTVLDMYLSCCVPKKQVLVTTSWDDGHVLDVKLAALLKKYGVTGTFYISPEDRELAPELRLSKEDTIALSADFEIGAHTMTHRHLTTLSQDEAYKEMVDSKIYLESLLQKPVDSFCYPAGMYRAEQVPLVAKAGFAYARTVRRFSFSHKKAPHEVETSVHTYDHYLDVWPLLNFVSFNPFTFLRLYLRWDKQAMAMFNKVYREGGVFHLWGHSWEVDDHHDWERLEAVLAHIGNRSDVVYITNGQQLSYELA